MSPTISSFCFVIIFYVQSIHGSEYVFTFYNTCSTNAAIIFDIKFTKTKPQKLNITMDFPYDIDDNLLMLYKLHSVSNTRKPLKLLEGTEKRGPCKFLNQFVGRFWEDVENRAGLKPNSCPLKKGMYRVNNYVPNFGTLNYQNLPRGQLVLNVEWKEKATNHMAFCCYLAIEIR